MGRSGWRPERVTVEPWTAGAVLSMVSAALLVAALFGCAHTIEAVQELPEGYWIATWDLVRSVVWDLLDLLSVLS